jgi:diadenosine tetraphosphate (Ap4A) HIT family hydrolase
MERLYDENCQSCQALQNLISLTVTPRVLETPYWIVEHAHPTSIKGWLVVILTRHCSALHGLTKAEWEDLGQLLPKLCQGLHKILDTEKEYIIQFAEGKRFNHVHFHVIARLPDWPDDLRGRRVFSGLGVSVNNALSADDLIPLVQELRAYLLSE